MRYETDSRQAFFQASSMTLFAGALQHWPPILIAAILALFTFVALRTAKTRAASDCAASTVNRPIRQEDLWNVIVGLNDQRIGIVPCRSRR